MSADLKWVAALIDQISAPAKKMTASLGGFEGAIDRADQALASFAGGKLAKAGDAIVKKLGGGFGAAKAAAAKFATGAAGAFLDVAKKAGEFALDDVIQGENLDLALKTLIGDAKKFDEATKEISGLANFWGGSDPDDLEKQMIALTSKGHDVAEALKIMQGAADLGVLGNDVNQLIDAFAMLDDKGQLSAKSLVALGKSGLDPKKLREVLGDAIGSSGDLQADIENAIKAGTLDTAKLQAAALQTITKMTGKALGGLAEEQGHTIGGLLDNLKHVPARLMDALDMSGSVEPARKALEVLTTALNPEGATGQKVVAALTRVSGAVGRVITAITGSEGEKVGGWIDALASGIEIVADVIDVTSDVVSGFVDEFMIGIESILGPMGEFGGGGIEMKDVVTALIKAFKFAGAVIGVTAGLVIQVTSWIVEAVVGISTALSDFVDWWDNLWRHTVPDALTDAIDWVSDAIDGLLDYFDDLWDSLKSIGSDIVDGIWEGIKAGWADLKKGWNDLVDELPESVASKLKIHSPSKVMQDLSGWAVEGFLGPVENANARAEAAGDDLAGALAVGAGAAGGSVRGGSIGHLEINVFVDGRGKGDDELGDAVGRGIVRALADVGLELGIESVA